MHFNSDSSLPSIVRSTARFTSSVSLFLIFNSFYDVFTKPQWESIVGSWFPLRCLLKSINEKTVWGLHKIRRKE